MSSSRRLPPIAQGQRSASVFPRGKAFCPQFGPKYFVHLVIVGINKKSYKQSSVTANVKDKYYELFHGQGGKGLERNESMEEG